MLACAVMIGARRTVAGKITGILRQRNGNRIGKVALNGKAVDCLVTIGFRTDNTAVFVIQKSVRVGSFV